MPIKIKVKPEDFRVEEIANLPFEGNGEFRVYLLKKSGWNTVDVLSRASKDLQIPLKDFSYGGRKDKHGLTAQYITIKNSASKNLEGKGYSFKFLGFWDRPMGPDLIQGNKFSIIIRNLKSEEIIRVQNEIEAVKANGFPNYFDDQRFGSWDSRLGFLAEKILKGHYRGALKIYACAKPEKQSWAEGKIASKGALVFLQKIPKEKLSIYFSCFQSYLWNEALRRVIQSLSLSAIKSYKGTVGDYLFYTELKAEQLQYLSALKLPTWGRRFMVTDARTRAIYEQVLKEHNLKGALLNKIKVRQVFLNSFERNALVIPKDFTFSLFPDELYNKKQKLELKFILGRGSFATMLVKRLFSV